MTTITSYEELKEMLESFAFEDIGFNVIHEGDHIIEYYRKYRYRNDLYVKVHKTNFETEIYSWNEKTRRCDRRIGTFNIRQPDELLFLLTYCINELRVEQPILSRYKREIGYDQTNVVPNRMPGAG